MKKRILTVLMALVMLVSLAACGGGKNPAGTYELTKMGDGSEELTAEELTEIAGTELESTLEMTKDNKFTLNMGILSDEETESVSGTWKLDGDSLILSVEGEELSATYNGKTVAMDMDGVLLTFGKQ